MKKNFLVNTSSKEKLSSLTDEELGKVFRHVFEYVETGVVPKMERIVEIGFNVLKVDVDENEKNYQSRVEANKNNGKLGGRPKGEKRKKVEENMETEKTQQNPKNPMGYFETEKTQPNPTKHDNDNDYDYELLNMSNLKENIQKKKFVKPTLEEVQTYCKERKNKVNAEKFIDYYNANGWKVGRNAMKDWKACVRNWERNDGSFSVNKREVQKPDWFDEKIEHVPATEEEQKEIEELLKNFR